MLPSNCEVRPNSAYFTMLITRLIIALAVGVCICTWFMHEYVWIAIGHYMYGWSVLNISWITISLLNLFRKNCCSFWGNKWCWQQDIPRHLSYTYTLWSQSHLSLTEFNIYMNAPRSLSGNVVMMCKDMVVSRLLLYIPIQQHWNYIVLLSCIWDSSTIFVHTKNNRRIQDIPETKWWPVNRGKSQRPTEYWSITGGTEPIQQSTA